MMRSSFHFFTALIFALLIAASTGCGGDETSATSGKDETTGIPENSDANENAGTSEDTIVEEDAETTSDEVAEEGAAIRDGVLIHLSEGPMDKFRVCMALKIAEDMAAANDVLVYFDQRGTEIAFKDTPDFEYNPFPRYKEQIAKLNKMGVGLKVCKPCVDAYFKTSGDLMPGIGMLEPGDLTNFTQGRIVSLDY